MQKAKALFFSVINKTLHFDKHGFFEKNSLVSSVARFPPFILKIQVIIVNIGNEEN